MRGVCRVKELRSPYGPHNDYIRKDKELHRRNKLKQPPWYLIFQTFNIKPPRVVAPACTSGRKRNILQSPRDTEIFSAYVIALLTPP